MTFDSYAKASSHGDAVYLSTCMSQEDKRDSRVGRSTESTPEAQLYNICVYVENRYIDIFVRFSITNTSANSNVIIRDYTFVIIIIIINKSFIFSHTHTYIRIRYFMFVIQNSVYNKYLLH